MSTPTSNSSAARRTPISISPDQNLIPPSLQSVLKAAPTMNTRPVTAETLAAAALLATLEMNASGVENAHSRIRDTSTSTIATATTTTTTTTATVTTTTTRDSDLPSTGNSSLERPVAEYLTSYLPLPPEKRQDVFRWIVRREINDGSLFQLSGTCKEAHGDVDDFLQHDKDGLAFSNRAKWRSNAVELAQNAQTLRQSARHIVVPPTTSTQAPQIDPVQNLSIHGVIKIDAKGIGRERVMAEVRALLEQVPSHAKVALDLSGNSLTALDLELLVESLERNPVVYQLSLDNNPLCQGDQICEPLVKLFSVFAPVSHLYLSNVGLNDATAAAVEPALATSPVLQHLDLRNNRLTTAGGIAIAQGIVPGTKVRTVRLQGNQFGIDEDVGKAVLRAHMKIDMQRLKEKGKEYDPTLDNDDEVEIIEIDGVRAGWFEFAALQAQFQRKFEAAALAQRI